MNFTLLAIILIQLVTLGHGKHCWTKATHDREAKCTTTPKCDDKLLLNNRENKIDTFLIDNKNGKIDQNFYENCTNIFDHNLNFYYKSIASIGSNAFARIRVKNNFTIKMDANGQDVLKINQHSFDSLIIEKHGRLAIEISNYEHVQIDDILLSSILQQENTHIVIIIRNCDDLSIDGGKNERQKMTFSKNTSYTLQINDVKRVNLLNLANIELTGSSATSILIKNTNLITFQNGLFTNLALSLDASFSLTIINSNFIDFGKDTFKNLQQDDNSLFILTVDTLTNRHLNLSNCLNIKENFIKNLKQTNGALMQLLFKNVSKSIHFEKNALNDISLSKDSKILILFDLIEQNVIFDEMALNAIELYDGLLHINVKNQQQAHFIFNNFSISSIYFSPGSKFKMNFSEMNGSKIVSYENTFYKWRKNDVDTRDYTQDFWTKLILGYDESGQVTFHLSKEGPQLVEIENRETSLSLKHAFCKYFSLYNANLIHFSSLFNSFSTTPKCSSCVLILLYRKAHRKSDFLSIRKFIPKCFKSIFYGDDSKLSTSDIDNALRQEWDQLNCKHETGLKRFNDDTLDLNQIAQRTCPYQILPSKIDEQKCFINTRMYDLVLKEAHEISETKKAIFVLMTIVLISGLVAFSIVFIHKSRTQLSILCKNHASLQLDEELNEFGTRFKARKSTKQAKIRSLFNFSALIRHNYVKLNESDECNQQRQNKLNVTYNVQNEITSIQMNKSDEPFAKVSQEMNVICNPIENIISS